MDLGNGIEFLNDFRINLIMGNAVGQLVETLPVHHIRQTKPLEILLKKRDQKVITCLRVC